METIVPLTVWRRPRITRACALSLMRMDDSPRVIFVCSPDDPDIQQQKTTASELGIDLVEAPNQPLGRKWTLSIEAARDYSWDRMLILGSDDLVSPELLSLYDPQKEAWGWSDCHFLGDGRLFHFRGYDSSRKESIGAGRMLSRDILCRAEWRLWDESLSKGLDASMTARLRSIGVGMPYAPIGGVHIVDVKGEVSVTPLSAYHRKRLAEVRRLDWPQWLLDLECEL